MKVDAYNFFFHPLHKEHSNEVKGLSIVTNIVLTALTNGLYLLLLGAVHTRECIMGTDIEETETADKAKKVFDKVHPPKDSDNSFVGLEALKQKQKEHLAKLEEFADNGQWKHLQRHTPHRDSGFDWWMFPTTRASNSYGAQYQLTPRYIQALQNDKDFMKSYREGVLLVAKSWGWDLENNVDFDEPDLKWDGYQVRLGKMLQSLTEFGQKDLHDNLVSFVQAHHIDEKLQKWIRPYLKPIPPSQAFIL